MQAPHVHVYDVHWQMNTMCWNLRDDCKQCECFPSLSDKSHPPNHFLFLKWSITKPKLVPYVVLERNWISTAVASEQYHITYCIKAVWIACLRAALLELVQIRSTVRYQTEVSKKLCVYRSKSVKFHFGIRPRLPKSCIYRSKSVKFHW